MATNSSATGLEQDVREVIAGYLKRPIGEIDLEAPLRESLGIDSFGMFELTFAFQEKYKLEIPEEELRKLQRGRDIINWLMKNGKGSN